MNLNIQRIEITPDRRDVEVVERKGIGHPDTLCDAIAEAICVRLCQAYVDQFGMILHHNVDKVLLCAGASRPSFGGGKLVGPIEIYLAGRATFDWRGARIEVNDIAVDACRVLLKRIVPGLDPERDVRIVPRFGRASADLAQLFERHGRAPLANDTSFGAGFAPFTDLERVVLGVEGALTSLATRHVHPEIGSDVKIMGVRTRDRIALTVGCAFVDRHVASLAAYESMRQQVRSFAVDTARGLTDLTVEATVNAGDDLAAGSVFLTVTGTSAESGDDGEVGRGNRASGLITPYRITSLEAAAGKNPASHPGKLYNVVSARIAAALVEHVTGVRSASCLLVSRIGHPIDDPQLVDVGIEIGESQAIDSIRAQIDDVARDQLQRFPEVRADLLAGRVTLF